MPSRRLSLAFARATLALFFGLALSVYGQTTDNQPKPTGTISGRVTVSERPVADILVAAQSADRLNQQPSVRAKTDANGRYRLAGLPAGQYQILTIAPAMAFAEQGGSATFYGPGKAVVLAAGEEVDEVDIQLVRGSVITGRVTDADGKPVIEERLNLQMIDQNGNPSKQQVFGMWNYQMSQTDDRGIYRLYGLSAGRYRVSVGSSEEGFMSSRNHTYYPLTFYGDTTDAAKAAVVELQEGSEATNIDIRVGRATRSFVASGRIVDSETGQPIPGIRLMHGPARQNQPFYGGYLSSRTGPRGEFRLEGLEPGRYGISVAASFEGGTHYSDPLLFEISETDVTNLELKASRGLTLSGTVVFEGSRARELKQNLGLLRVGANVTSSTNPQNTTSAYASIAADGSFQIMAVRPGKLRLFVGAMSNSALRGVTILRAERGGVDVTQNLELQSGESVTDLRIVAALGAGTIHGTVRFVGGVPPANLRVFVNTRREGMMQGGGGPVDARGRFVINDLVAGSYEVILNMSQEGEARRQIPPQKQTVTVSDMGETQVDFIVDLAKEGGRP